MSIYSEYRHGLISRQELINAYNLTERKDEYYDEEERCWKEGTGSGDCGICPYASDCSGGGEDDDE